VHDAVVGIVAYDGGLVAPLRSGESGKVGLDQPELAHGLEILDLGIHAETLERFQVADAVQVLLQVIRLPLVHGHRQHGCHGAFLPVPVAASKKAASPAARFKRPKRTAPRTSSPALATQRP